MTGKGASNDQQRFKKQSIYGDSEQERPVSSVGSQSIAKSIARS